MERREMAKLVGILSLAGLAAGKAQAEPMHEEFAEHPRIARAIHEIEDAIHYLEEAPHNFGGHKEAAIEACRHAVEQLRRAMEYRARRD